MYTWENNLNLLETLIEIRGVSGDEQRISHFVIDYVKTHQHKWKSQPTIYAGKGFQDAVILVFGNPKTAMYAHMDTIGFTVGYNNNLIKVGGPKPDEGIELVGEDSNGPISCELMIIEDEDHRLSLKAVYDREIERGTCLSYAPNFRVNEDFISSPYIDNRLGVWMALQTAAQLEHGAIVFSTYEEHGGGSVGFLGKFLLERYGVDKALICDITWKTEGVQHGDGVAISMRDSGIPRRSYLESVIRLAEQSGIPFQLEVESAGGSDGQALQRSSYQIDWVFIGAPEDHVHTPDESIHKFDVDAMLKMYIHLMQAMNKEE